MQPPDPIPTQFNNAVVLWKQGHNTKIISEKLWIKEPVIERWINWHLDAKHQEKANALR